jgi:hypothetical protein
MQAFMRHLTTILAAKQLSNSAWNMILCIRVITKTAQAHNPPKLNADVLYMDLNLNS